MRRAELGPFILEKRKLTQGYPCVSELLFCAPHPLLQLCNGRSLHLNGLKQVSSNRVLWPKPSSLLRDQPDFIIPPSGASQCNCPGKSSRVSIMQEQQNIQLLKLLPPRGPSAALPPHHKVTRLSCHSPLHTQISGTQTLHRQHLPHS